MYKNIRNIGSFALYNIFGKLCLFTPEPIDRGSIGESLYMYDVRGTEDYTKFASIERYVHLNKLGTLIVDEPIHAIENGGKYIDLTGQTGETEKDGFVFSSGGVIKQFDDVKLVDYFITRGRYNGSWKIPAECILDENSKSPDSLRSVGRFFMNVHVIRHPEDSDMDHERFLNDVRSQVEQLHPDINEIIIDSDLPKFENFYELFEILQAVYNADLVVMPDKPTVKVFRNNPIIKLIYEIREKSHEDVVTFGELLRSTINTNFRVIEENGTTWPMFNVDYKDELIIDTARLKGFVGSPVRLTWREKNNNEMKTLDAVFNKLAGEPVYLLFRVGEELLGRCVYQSDMLRRLHSLTLDFSVRKQKEEENKNE